MPCYNKIPQHKVLARKGPNCGQLACQGRELCSRGNVGGLGSYKLLIGKNRSNATRLAMDGTHYVASSLSKALRTLKVADMHGLDCVCGLPP